MSILERAKKVSTCANSFVKENESLGRLHDDVVKAMQQSELPQMLKPGSNYSIKEFIEVCGILGEGCMSAGWCNFVWGMHNYLIGLYPKKIQSEVWSNPKTLVSASLNPQGTCDLDENTTSAKIDGHWTFNSGCDHADWLLLGCKKEEGEPVLALLHKSEYLIDEDSWDVLGLKGTGSKDAKVDQISIPTDRILPFSQVINPLAALLTLVIVGPVIGGAQSSVNTFASTLKKKQTQIEKDPFLNIESLYLKLAEASAEVDAARSIVVAAADLLDTNPTPDKRTTSKISRDTAFAAKLCNAATRRLFESSGGSALHQKNTMQRIFRDVSAGCNHAQLSWERLAAAHGRQLLEDAL